MPSSRHTKGQHAEKNRSLLSFLALGAIAMFGFGFALVPLYNVMCRTLNINGKVYQSDLDGQWIDRSRQVNVQFITTNHEHVPVTFVAKHFEIQVHPGENKHIDFDAENLTNHTLTLQAIPSITPHEAAPYLRKTQCFCFTQQTLEPHAHRRMPVIFHLEPTLPKHIDTVTLSYTLFDITDRKPNGNSTTGRRAVGRPS